jgi:hypothetical protein
MKKVKWTGYIVCKSCLAKRVIKRKIEGKRGGTRRQEGRRKQLFNDINEMLGYWNMKNGTPWITCFRRRCGILRKKDKRNEKSYYSYCLVTNIYGQW